MFSLVTIKCDRLHERLDAFNSKYYGLFQVWWMLSRKRVLHKVDNKCPHYIFKKDVLISLNAALTLLESITLVTVRTSVWFVPLRMDLIVIAIPHRKNW